MEVHSVLVNVGCDCDCVIVMLTTTKSCIYSVLGVSSGTLVMRPAGNENKGAMKLRVDFKKKHTGELFSYFLHSSRSGQI